MEKFDKQKFLFSPLIPHKGKAKAPTLMIHITKAGCLYLNSLVMDMLSIELTGAFIQVFADYEKRALAVKVIKSMKIGDGITDKSIRFIKPTIQKKGNAPFMIISIKTFLKQLGSVELPVKHLEFKKYSDVWTPDVWYITIPRQVNPNKIKPTHEGSSKETTDEGDAAESKGRN